MCGINLKPLCNLPEKKKLVKLFFAQLLKLQVGKVWAQNVFIHFYAKLDAQFGLSTLPPVSMSVSESGRLQVESLLM